MCLCCYGAKGTAQLILPYAVAFSVLAVVCIAVACRFKITFTAVVAMLLCAAIPLGVYLVKCSDDKYEAASEYVGKHITVEGTVYRYEKIENGYTVYLRVCKADGKDIEKFNLRIRSYGTASPLLYDTAVFEVTPSEFEKTYYLPYSVGDYYRSEGVHLDADGQFVGTKNKGKVIYRIIRYMENAMGRALDGLSSSSLARALIIGDKSYLDEHTSNVFSRAGIAHVLALSGLHIGVILLFIRKVLGACTCPKYIIMLVSTVTVLFYIVMTGGSYSVMRAGIMAVAGFGAYMFFMRRDFLSGVAISVTLILMYEPYAVKSLSFQLSCGAIVGIGVFALPVIKKIKNRFEKYTSDKKDIKSQAVSVAFAVLSSLVVTFSVLLFTFPTTLYYMGDILPVSFLSNVIIIPLAAPVMMVLIIYVLIYLIPLFPIRLAAVNLIAPCADLLLGIFEGTAEFFAWLNIPQINLTHMAYPVLSVAVAAALAILILYKSRISGYLAVFAITAVVCITCFVVDSNTDYLRVHYLSDGDCSCAVFEHDGKSTVYAHRGDALYAVKSHCSEYLKDDIDNVVISPQCDEYISLIDGLCTNGIAVKSVFLCDGDENGARIKSTIKSIYPKINIYEYETDKPFLNCFTLTSSGVLKAEAFSRCFAISPHNENNELCGDVIVTDNGRVRKAVSENRKEHEITYCKTHIFNITHSKITMRCYG